MSHIRGKLLSEDLQVLILDSLDGIMGSHQKKNGHRSWFGQFELPNEVVPQITPATHYQLVLNDGRSGMVYLDIHDCNTPGMSAAEFHVIGDFKKR